MQSPTVFPLFKQNKKRTVKNSKKQLYWGHVGFFVNARPLFFPTGVSSTNTQLIRSITFVSGFCGIDRYQS
jgi:hypothetical protein